MPVVQEAGEGEGPHSGATTERNLTNVRSDAAETDEEEDFLGALEGLPYHRSGFDNLFDMGKQIAGGYSSVVYTCCAKMTGVVHAVKVYHLEKWTTTTHNRKLEQLRNEVAVLQKSQEDSHPHILSMIDLFADYSRRTVFIVMELAEHGVLFDLIVQLKKLSEEQTRGVLTQLFSAVEFLVRKEVQPPIHPHPS
jgi:serine/threonine protein kinase